MTDVEMNQNRRPLETQVDRALHASESLEFYARQVAEAHSVSSSLRPRRYLLADLGRQRAFLRTAYDYFREAGEELLAASYAAEWLLDNFYLVERALRLLREDMPEHYYRQLPLLKNSPMAGLPRVYALAHHIVHYTQGSLEREAIERFLHAYQSVTPLAMGEIWALPLMLRLASIENTLRAIARVTDLEAPPIEDAPGDYLAQELSDDLIVGNSIHSLRVLDTVDWETFFDNVSRVEQILRRDPGNIYARMDFETRNQYRRVIEDIARAAGTDEERVAHIAVNLARDAATDEWRQSRNARAVDIGGDGDGHIIDLRRVVAQTSQAHVGYYLLDAGKARLEAELSYRPGAVDRLRRWVHVHPTRVYLGGISLVTLGLLLIMLRYAVAVGAGVGTLIAVILLGLVPAVTVSVNVVNWIVTHTVPPRVLPRLDLRDGIPRRYRTIVVIPSLLTSEGEVKSLVEQLERHYLGNNDPQLYFALLTDLADADQETLPEDEALIAQAEEGIRILNKRYGIAGRGPFYLFHRRRQWNPAEGRWMGWERKRGKLVEFNRLLHGAQDTSYILPDGLPRPLTSIRYVITLDADTVLPRDAAVDLVATIAHPLNRARFDEHNRVYAGYTVLQPRVEIMPTSAGRSLFARIFAGDQGLDLYTRAVSDVYHDLMGEGVYAGKGIYDVAAFERCLEGRVPDNTLLSHDLFEGIHGRAGLVSDVTLIEEYPEHYLAYVRRMHRWIRGDWQIMPWLFRRVPYADGSRGQNDLSTLDRWKILDNLRRSLLWPALVALWVAGWFWLPGSPLFWTLAGVAALAMPVLSELVDQAISGIESGSFSGAGYTLRTVADRQLLMLTFVPFHAAVALDAIVRTLIRMTITHRNMLQWTTAAHTNRIIRRSNSLMIWQEMAVAPLTALVAGGATLFAAPEALPVAAPLLFMWLLSPQIAYRISRPIVRLAPTLTDEERQRLRRLARRTWLFFEEFVGPDDNWLPPDHYQQSPRGVVARRTSPTNIGLMLLASLLAYDLGYLEPNELALRLGYSFDTLERMEKHRGHLLNWYTTHTLEPLPPRYVSTVDSGNMVASLMTLRQGCLEMPDTPVLRWQSWQGLIDTLGMLSEVIDELDDEDTHRPEAVHIQEHIQRLIEYILDYEDHPERWPGLLQDILSTQVPGLEQDLLRFLETGIRADAERLRSLHAWIERVRRHVGTMQHDVSQLMPWPFLLRRSPEWMTADDASMEVRTAWQDLLDVLPQGVSYREIPVVCEAALPRLSALQAVLDADSGPEEALRPARAWCATLANTLETARNTSRRLLNDYARLADRAETLFREMDFEFLFDEQREVFYIGYNVDAGRIDEHHYDLLTSEARTASLVTIARDEISQSHWLHLGRPLTLIQGERALLSWSGTMFEYLMPTMFVRQYDGTLLSQSCRLAVEHQIAYGRSHGVPWGISESGYYRFDAAMNYQYYAFGAPGLGFSRGLGEHMVITPYASFLALGIRPDAVMRNAEHLQQLGMLGRYGFFEAIDFTPSRLPAGQRHAIVQSYMAHHQAMILVPMANYLAKDCIVRRFHADPRVQSVELLLQEQVPQRAPLEQTMLGEPPVVRPDQPQVTAGLWTRPVDPPLPEAHVLSNGRYTLMITSAGAGYSRWRDLDLTRWHNDTTLDDAGTWIYLRDAESGDLWSLAHQPIPGPPDAQEAVFYPHMAEFKRRQHEITSQVDVTVSLEDDVEVRRVRLTNNSDRPRRLMLFSYAEVAIGPHDDDQRHPAFSKLFVESEFVADVNGLLFRRRPRSSSQEPIYMLHLLTTEKDGPFTGAHESDRMRFLGRGGSARRPGVLLDQKGILSGTTGATLDPVMSIGQELSLAPHESVQVAYVTLAGRTRQEALQLAGKYQSWPSIERAFGQSRSRIEIEMRQMGLDTTDIAQIQRLLSAVIYPYQALRAVPATLAGNTRGQPSLWPYAISGDYPILLIDVEKADHVPLVQDALQAYIYWRKRQTKVDLVILNRRESGYSQEFQNQLRRLVRRIGDESWINDRGGIFLLQADQMSPDDLTLLETSARVILKGDKGTLGQQLEALDRRPLRLPAFNPIRSGPAEERPETPPLPRPTDLRYDNGLGGFSADGREYVIYLEPGRWTPAPWVNVVANEDLGFLISESGGGYTWAINSGENRLTPWHNDPVSDPSDEALYLRDEETGEIWSPTPLPAREDAPYLVRHGAGYTRFEHHSHGLIQHTRFYIAPDDPVKIVRLRLENTAPWTRRITATFYASWVLYTSHEASQMYVIPEYDGERYTLLARNPYNTEFGERVAFAASSRVPHGLTTDRQEFFGRMGDRVRPAALSRVGLEGRVEAGEDPCAAIQVHLDLDPGEVEEVHFILGQGADREHALRLAERYRTDEGADVAWEETSRMWDDLLGTVQIETPDEAMNLLTNRWLLYQVLSCRIWGRSGFYQSSGAYGFRDQLQDVMSMIHAAPHVARKQILRAAAHQFEEGDVLHWWHPPSGRGVRTRISDDLLWLPYVTAHYVRTTGDWSILDQEVPYLQGDPLDRDEEERYDHYRRSEHRGSLYEHCLRAIRRGAASGPHGLPLIGGGDWNDGMNRVGIHGQGESIWLGWFLYSVMTRFADIARQRNDEAQADWLLDRAEQFRDALEAHGWDGDWYRRAYYDDGTPLGSAQNDECKIDAIAQSWSVLSGAGDPQRSELAMKAVSEWLVRPDDRLILLFTPPLDKTPKDPGYIKGYLPGVRENGGQYTHAAVWTTWAYAEMGQYDRAIELYRLINPIYHSDSTEGLRRYQVEPYVIAADVYGVPPHVGRGGWTWYTGSASWFYRLGLEGILGVHREGDALRIRPRIPAAWPGYRISYRYGKTVYEISVKNPRDGRRGARRVVGRIMLDGETLKDEVVSLRDDGQLHRVEVTLVEGG